VLCFFFEAEDGIRDFHVTGVQTCALPISSSPTERLPSSPAPGWRPWLRPPAGPARAAGRRSCSAARSLPASSSSPAWSVTTPSRSEERRVGRDNIYSWYPEQSENNILLHY